MEHTLLCLKNCLLGDLTLFICFFDAIQPSIGCSGHRLLFKSQSRPPNQFPLSIFTMVAPLLPRSARFNSDGQYFQVMLTGPAKGYKWTAPISLTSGAILLDTFTSLSCFVHPNNWFFNMGKLLHSSLSCHRRLLDKYAFPQPWWLRLSRVGCRQFLGN